MGMSLETFEALTPAEWHACYEAWHHTSIREPWERVRFAATAVLQPWTRKRVKATDLVRFQWDGEQARQAAKDAPASTEERMRQVMGRLK